MPLISSFVRVYTVGPSFQSPPTRMLLSVAAGRPGRDQSGCSVADSHEFITCELLERLLTLHILQTRRPKKF